MPAPVQFLIVPERVIEPSFKYQTAARAPVISCPAAVGMDADGKTNNPYAPPLVASLEAFDFAAVCHPASPDVPCESPVF